MKIIQVIDSLQVGGAEKVMINMTNLLFNKGEDVSALIFAKNPGALFKNLHNDVPKILLNRKSAYNILDGFKLYKTLKNYDIVHVHMRHNFAYVSFFAKLFSSNFKIILHDHYGAINLDKKIPLALKLIKPKYFIGVSKPLTDWAHFKLKIPRENVFLLENTIEPRKIKVKTIQNNVKQYVSVGNIKPIKNQLFIIKLMSKIEGNLTIYGKIQDDNYYHKLIQEISKTKVHDRINIITDETDIQDKLFKYDMALHTASSESGPLVLIEYLAHNLPFLAYKTGSVADKLNKSLPNMFLDNFDLTQWKNRINELKSNKGQMKQLFERNYSPENYHKTCLNIYKRI